MKTLRDFHGGFSTTNLNSGPFLCVIPNQLLGRKITILGQNHGRAYCTFDGKRWPNIRRHTPGVDNTLFYRGVDINGIINGKNKNVFGELRFKAINAVQIKKPSKIFLCDIVHKKKNTCVRCKIIV